MQQQGRYPFQVECFLRTPRGSRSFLPRSSMYKPEPLHPSSEDPLSWTTSRIRGLSKQVWHRVSPKQGTCNPRYNLLTAFEPQLPFKIPSRFIKGLGVSLSEFLHEGIKRVSADWVTYSPKDNNLGHKRPNSVPQCSETPCVEVSDMGFVLRWSLCKTQFRV